jgi:hypothetical protein
MLKYLQKGGHYKLVIETNGVILTFRAIVVDSDSMFVTFIDDIKHKTSTFNLNKIVSIEKLSDSEENDRNSKSTKKG